MLLSPSRSACASRTLPGTPHKSTEFLPVQIPTALEQLRNIAGLPHLLAFKAFCSLFLFALFPQDFCILNTFTSRLTTTTLATLLPRRHHLRTQSSDRSRQTHYLVSCPCNWLSGIKWPPLLETAGVTQLHVADCLITDESRHASIA